MTFQLPAYPSLNVNYHYDGLGRRLAKVGTQNETSSGENARSSFTQSFIYLGEEDKILLSQDGLERPTLQIDNQGITAYLGDHLGELSANKSKAYQKDHLGSVMNSRALDDSDNSDSQLHSDRIYGVFGESDSKMTLTPSSAAVVYGFAGGEYDAESGRYYFRARVYDPDTGRWMTKDPIGFAGGDTNLYIYATNDSINLIDSDGESPKPPQTTPTELLEYGTSRISPEDRIKAEIFLASHGQNPNLNYRTEKEIQNSIVDQLKNLKKIQDLKERLNDKEQLQCPLIPLQ